MIRTSTVVTLLMLLAVPVGAQGSKADYERASGLRKQWANKVKGPVRVAANWFDEGKRLWYRKQGPDGKDMFVVVEAATGKRTESGERPEGQSAPQRQRSRRGRGRARRNEPRSLDDRWVVHVRDHDLWIESAAQTAEKKPIRLTKDGEAKRPWAFVSWGPDSKSLVACRVDPGAPGEVINVTTAKKHGDPATVRTRTYARPGDKMTTRELYLFLTDDWQPIKVEADAIDFRSVQPRWRADGSSFTYEKRDRGHRRDRIIEVDAKTGKTRTLLDEQAKTFLDHYRKAFVRYLDETREILWASERDGWNHLYLYDAAAGTLKNRVTKGEWLVRRVDHVDTDKRQVWFRAYGFAKGQDPYHVHYLRVNFDGTGLVQMTDGDGTHDASYSPDRSYLVDTYSRVDLPPVTELRRTSDGELVCTLERCDASRLEAAGWRAPERFVAKGRDGKTDIWGIIVRPTNFDASRSYPVLEYIYAGPHDSHVPKTFAGYRRMHAMAELGFVVVQIDGMGTNNRSKAFLDVCWHNIADAGFPDRKLWIQAAADKYPAMDTSRVGIYGTSAGGQSALGALLFHGDFYKVAVSSCGCHDNRIDKASWNEQWMGYPVGPHYREQSNVTHAAKLNGKVLLMVGELDTNVPPESTYQVVDALIKADKDFDLVVIPGAGHGSGGRYGERRRRDFFVRHLLGRELDRAR
jgi:dipeptidyl aminopeptidase/acylaminoacyl peptidase